MTLFLRFTALGVDSLPYPVVINVAHIAYADPLPRGPRSSVTGRTNTIVKLVSGDTIMLQDKYEEVARQLCDTATVGWPND